MNALAIYAVNAHIADLLAEASAQRTTRRPKGRGFVASLLASVRGAFAPQPLPKLHGYPYRG